MSTSSIGGFAPSTSTKPSNKPTRRCASASVALQFAFSTGAASVYAAWSENLRQCASSFCVSPEEVVF